MEVPNISLSNIFGGGKPPADENISADPSTGTAATTVEKEVAVAPAVQETDSVPVVAEASTTLDQDVAAVPADAPETVTAEKAETVEKDVAPAVEHETKVEKHETKEQTVIDKERHQDVYHTTIQPVKDMDILPTEHKTEETATEVKEFDHDDGAVKDKVATQNAGFENTSEQAETISKTTEEPTKVANEEVVQHLHETIQPVIEKETIQPTVTHKTINVKEIHQDAAKDAGTTVNAPISVAELQKQMGLDTKPDVDVQTTSTDNLK